MSSSHQQQHRVEPASSEVISINEDSVGTTVDLLTAFSPTVSFCACGWVRSQPIEASSQAKRGTKAKEGGALMELE